MNVEAMWHTVIDTAINGDPEYSFKLFKELVKEVEA